MEKTVVIEEFHLTISVPATLTPDQAGAIRETINDTPFLARLRRAIRATFRGNASLAIVRLSLTR